MCVVIDINTIPDVFSDSARSLEFQPLLEWVKNTRAQIVYGGTTYKKELSKLPRYFQLLSELKTAGKVLELPENEVNAIQSQVASRIVNGRFNDQAIVAIVVVSGCRVVCSSDKKSFPFIKEKALYPKGFCLPIIYTSKKQKPRLYSREFHAECGPCAAC